jgi:hypothetical protein
MRCLPLIAVLLCCDSPAHQQTNVFFVPRFSDPTCVSEQPEPDLPDRLESFA